MNRKRLFADLSDYQSTFDAHAYRSAGHILVALKAGEDTSNGGASHYEDRCHRAHHAGLSVMHYWFTRPENKNPNDEAKFFCDRVKPNFHPTDLLALDVETGGEFSPYWFTVHMEMEIHKRLGVNPVVYSYLSYFREYNLRARGKKLWIAAFDNRRTPNSLPIIRGQHRWAKQFSDNFTFAGVGHSDGSCLSLSGYRALARIRRKHHLHS